MKTIESVLIGYVGQKTAVHTGGEIPGKRTGSYIVAQKRGGGKSNHIPSATMQFDCYAPTLFEACELSQKVIRAVEESTALDDIASVEFGGDYNSTDTERKVYCYTAMFEITHYL